jgi:endonuclease/exonuclease/phosphatase family metal-dependent hydrolase
VSERHGHARVLTWNIHAGIGPDRAYDLDRVVALVRKHDPDIIALQEIDSRGRDGNASPFDLLNQALGAHAAEARTITAPDGHYGHAVISRWPLSNIILHNLSVSRREPRLAIQTDIATPYGPLHLAAVHLGLSLYERRAQAVALATIATTAHETAVLLGDFNEWTARGAVGRALAQLFPVHTRHRTFPARWPMLMLDRIYCRPLAAMARSWTDRTCCAASDHLPVIADIRIAPDQPRASA